MITEQEIVIKYLKVKYKKNGTDPKTGLDCWNLVKVVYADLGRKIIDLIDFAGQCPAEKFQQLSDMYENLFEEVYSPEQYDLILLLNDGLLHSGIVLSKRRFFHIGKAGVSVNRFDSRPWKDKIIGFYRYKKC
jgi:hypothetical protein